MSPATDWPSPSTTCAAVTPEAGTANADVTQALSRIPGGVVDGGEMVLLAIKPSMWRPLFESGWWLAFTALAAVAIVSLAQPIPGLSIAASLQIALAVGFGRLALAILRWVPRWYVLTNRRVLDIAGIREPRIWSCPLIEVRNTYLAASTAENLAGVGTVTFVTEHAHLPPRLWKSINQPQEVHARIRRAIEHAIDHHDTA